MSLTPKTDSYPACHGIACPRHNSCKRWHAVESAPSDINTMATCLTGEAYPEFVDRTPPRVAPIEVAAQSGHA